LNWVSVQKEGLTENQLEAIEKLSFNTPRFQKVLDRFIVGCYTGMAHSDITNCKKDNIVHSFADNNEWINIKRTKTGEDCKIPILPPVQAIIDKYKNDPACIKANTLFPNVHLNSCNELLKDIAGIAGIKNIKVSTHTARHTFAQMAMDLGVNIEAIAEILGHSDSKTTKSSYARTSHKFVSNEINNLKDKKFPGLKIVQQDKAAG